MTPEVPVDGMLTAFADSVRVSLDRAYHSSIVLHSGGVKAFAISNLFFVEEGPFFLTARVDNNMHIKIWQSKTESSSSSFVFRVFSPSRGLHAKMFSFQHFPPQEPVHWVNTNHIPVFFVMQDCICPVFLRPSITATILNNQVCYMSNASFISLHMPLPSQSVVSHCRFDISETQQIEIHYKKI